MFVNMLQCRVQGYAAIAQQRLDAFEYTRAMSWCVATGAKVDT